jgi:hypothetical protein
MSMSSHKQDDSDDEFESADEGEPTTPPIIKSPTPPPPPPPSDPTPSPINEHQVQSISLPPVTDGWGDWNIDDEPLIEKSIQILNPPQQDSASSLSSSPSKTGGSLSQADSDNDDDDDQIDLTNQQRLQRKKYRKKQAELNLNNEESKPNTRLSRPIERRDEETVTTTKHDVKDAHHVLDRLAAQSPTRTVYLLNNFINQYNYFLFFFSQLGIRHGVILDHYYLQQNKVFQH